MWFNFLKTQVRFNFFRNCDISRILYLIQFHFEINKKSFTTKKQAYYEEKQKQIIYPQIRS